MEALGLIVVESLDLTDFKSVFRSLARCLDPDSSNVGRGFQTLSVKLNSIILSVQNDFFYLRKRKPVSKHFQKGMNLEISKSKKKLEGIKFNFFLTHLANL